MSSAIVKAIEENLYAFVKSQFTKWPRFEIYDEPDQLRLMCDVPSPVFNMVHRTRCQADEADEVIECVRNQYAARGLPVLWWIEPLATPMDLGRRLITKGFKPAGEMTGMALEPRNLAIPESLENLLVDPVCDPKSLHVFAQTMYAGFQMPEKIMQPMIDLTTAMGSAAAGPLINYIGTVDGRPVSTSSLYFGAGSAGIYNVSTIAEERGRGYGAAMTAAALQEASNRGCGLVVLHASAMARSLYERLGFQSYCYFHEYTWNNPNLSH